MRNPESDHELGASIQAAIATLPEPYRGVATLHFVHGHRLRELALLHGLSLAAVKMRLHRARLWLRRRLEAVAPP